MSTKAQVKTQAKTPAAPRPVHAEQPPLAVPEREVEWPDMAAQLEDAARLGHSLGAIRVNSAAPSRIQTQPLIQRQPVPEGEEDEEELQMQREPAAVQRQGLPEEKQEKELQMMPDIPQMGLEGGRVAPDVEAAIQRARGGGQPLDSAVQAQMGETLGYDFSDVRVHTDAQADALNQQLSAKAFTTGRDLFFRRGAYDPRSSSGRELLAHELTHVVQQRTGRLPRSGGSMIVRPTGEEFEHEAETQFQGIADPGYTRRPSLQPKIEKATRSQQSPSGLSTLQGIIQRDGEDVEDRRNAIYKKRIEPQLKELRYSIRYSTTEEDENLTSGAYCNHATMEVVVDKDMPSRERVDAILFELGNVKRQPELKKAMREWGRPQGNLSQYGKAKAATEAGAELEYVKTIKELLDEDVTLIRKMGTQARARITQPQYREYMHGEMGEQGLKEAALKSLESTPHAPSAEEGSHFSLPSPQHYEIAALEELSRERVKGKLMQLLPGKLRGDYGGWIGDEVYRMWPEDAEKSARPQVYVELIRRVVAKFSSKVPNIEEASRTLLPSESALEWLSKRL